MSTTSNVTTALVCRGTPTVSVVDNRGLSVRKLHYNRSAVGESANERITQQHYSVSGQLLSSIDPRLFAAQQVDPTVLPNVRYHSSLSSRVLLRQSQDAGNQVTLYDVESGPVWQDNRHGHRKRFVYDGLHRLSALYEQVGSSQERISERYVYGERQAHAEQSNSRGQVVRHYDTAGLNEVTRYTISGQPEQRIHQLLRDDRVQSDWQGAESQWPALLGPERFHSQLGYNAVGEVLNSVDAKGNQQHQHFDVAGQLASSGLTLANESVERPVLISLTYSAGGQVLREAAGNGVVTDYCYEPQTLRLSRLLTTRPAQGTRSSQLQDLSYVYDPVGNVLSIRDEAIDIRYHNNQLIQPVNTYQYDALYQLLTATGRENAGAGRQGSALPPACIGDPNQFSNYTRQYSYDPGGNLTQVRHVGHSNYTLDMLVSSESNRTVQQTEFLTAAYVEGQFDAAGNLKKLVDGQPIVWNGRNQLQRVTQVVRGGNDDDEEHYEYDGGGTRVRKTTVSHTSGTTRRAQVIYLPGLELRRTESTQGGTTRTEEELHVISVASAGRQQVRVLHWQAGKPGDIPNDQLRASLDNQIGSGLLELDQGADVLTQEEYFPFGGTAVWSGKNASETKYKFVRYSGKERDVTGLYYYGFRYYAPWLGRWINPDPAGTVDGLNLYAMVLNNPISYADNGGLARYQPGPLQNRLSNEYWLSIRDELQTQKKGAFGKTSKKGAAATGSNGKSTRVASKNLEKADRRLETIVKETAPRLLSSLEKVEADHTDSLDLFRGMSHAEAESTLEWFNGGSREKITQLISGGELKTVSASNLTPLVEPLIIPTVNHLGDLDQAKKYAGTPEQGQVLKFTLKPGAETFLFSQEYLAIAPDGKGFTQVVRDIAELKGEDTYRTGSRNEGALGGYIGSKSEQAGPFSLSLGQSKPSRLLFQQFISKIEKMDRKDYE